MQGELAVNSLRNYMSLSELAERPEGLDQRPNRPRPKPREKHELTCLTKLITMPNGNCYKDGVVCKIVFPIERF